MNEINSEAAAVERISDICYGKIDSYYSFDEFKALIEWCIWHSTTASCLHIWHNDSHSNFNRILAAIIVHGYRVRLSAIAQCVRIEIVAGSHSISSRSLARRHPMARLHWPLTIAYCLLCAWMYVRMRLSIICFIVGRTQCDTGRIMDICPYTMLVPRDDPCLPFNYCWKLGRTRFTRKIAMACYHSIMLARVVVRIRSFNCCWNPGLSPCRLWQTRVGSHCIMRAEENCLWQSFKHCYKLGPTPSICQMTRATYHCIMLWSMAVLLT